MLSWIPYKIEYYIKRKSYGRWLEKKLGKLFMSSEIYIPVQHVQVISRVNLKPSQCSENEFIYIMLRLGRAEGPWF